jgi:hypothetical protein
MLAWQAWGPALALKKEKEWEMMFRRGIPNAYQQ